MTGTRGKPSARESEIADSVREHGSVTAAATALGISRVTVEATLSRYHQRVCDSRVSELEDELNFLRERRRVDQAAQRLEAVVGRIERAVAPVSHRRLADGGTRVREQRRQSGGVR